MLRTIFRAVAAGILLLSSTTASYAQPCTQNPGGCSDKCPPNCTYDPDLGCSCEEDPGITIYPVDPSGFPDTSVTPAPGPPPIPPGDKRRQDEFKDSFTVDSKKFPQQEKSVLPNLSLDVPGQKIYDDQGNQIGFIPNDTLPQAQTVFRSTPNVIQHVSGTEPVAANGEFTVDETDFVLAGFGVPFVFERHYRSGVDFQSQLGYGWNHTFGRRLTDVNGNYSPTCSKLHSDILYFDERMNRARFTYQSTSLDGVTDYFVSSAPGPKLLLSRNNRDLRLAWTLVEPSGVRYRFDRQFGTVSAIEDVSGTHAITVHWDRSSWPKLGGKPDYAIDTTGRKIYLVYRTKSFVQDRYPYSTQDKSPFRGQFEYLSCLSFTETCSDGGGGRVPLPAGRIVSFDVAPAPRVKWDFRNAAAGKGVFSTSDAPDDVEFDLVHVEDANHQGPTYLYYSKDTWTLPNASTSPITSSYVPDREIEPNCHALCDDRALNCHGVDLCQQLVVPYYQSVCTGVEDPKGRCHDWCMYRVPLTYRCGHADPTDPSGPICSTGADDQRLLRCIVAHTGGGPYSAEGKTCDEWKADCLQVQANAAEGVSVATLDSRCRQNCLDTCSNVNRAQRAGNPTYAYGQIEDLFHNLVRVTDGDGRVVTYNQYETDPFSPNFDRVVAHWQGEVPSLQTRGRRVVSSALHSIIGVFSNLHMLGRYAPVGPLPPDDPDRGQSMRFDYHDLEAEQSGHGRADPTYVESPQLFRPLQICPRHCIASHIESGSGCNAGMKVCDRYGADYDPAVRWYGPHSFQPPAFAVVTHDFDGTIKTNYYDYDWRILRNVNQTAGTAIDFNYADGFLTGIQRETGQRTCVTSDAEGRPLRVTELPAPNRPGDTASHVVEFQYDQRGQLIQQVREPGSGMRAGQRYLRDALERIIAVGEQVDADHARWTCYSYADPLLPPSGNVLQDELPESFGDEVLGGYWSWLSNSKSRLRHIVSAIARWYAPNSVLFPQTGCAADLRLGQAIVAGRRWRDLEPSRITLPDRSVTTRSGFTPFGPGSVIVDAAGAAPVRRYQRIVECPSLDPGCPRGFRGQYFEAGRLDDNGNRKPGSRNRSLLDWAGLLKMTGRQSPVTGNWVDTQLKYNSSHQLKQIIGPKYERDFRVDALGNVVSIHDIPRPGPALGAVPRTECRHVDITGRVLSVVQPEGNYEQHVHDAAARLTEVWRGYSWNALGDWAADCQSTATPVRPNEIPERVLTIGYDQDGFPNIVTQAGIRRDIVVDGFGRLVDEITPFRPAEPRRFLGATYMHHVRGYDDLGRVAWEGVFGTPPQQYAKPSQPESTIFALSEFHYDLLSRPVEVQRWRFAIDPFLIGANGPEFTRFAYDDGANTLTISNDDGIDTITRRDGAGRLRHSTVGAGTGSAIDRDYVNADGGDSFTVTQTPAPTSTGKLAIQYQLDGLGLISSITEGGRTLLSETHDELGLPQARSTNREQHHLDYDAYDRVHADHTQVAADQEFEVDYLWDGNDRLRGIQDGAGHSITQTFDGLDRLYQTITGVGTSTLEYAAGSGRVKAQTDAAGTTQSITYDGAGRAVQVDTVDGPGLSRPGFKTTRLFSYSRLGDIESAVIRDSEHSVATTFRYDSLRRKLGESSDAIAFSIEREYKPRTPAASAQTTTTFVTTSSSVLMDSFDELGRLAAVSLNQTSLARYQYAAGALDHVTLGNGVMQSTTYDEHARAVGTTISARGAQLASLTEGFGDDDVPRIRRRQVGQLPPVTDLFKTDLAGRITDENLAVPGVTLPTGNITNDVVAAFWNPSQPNSSFALDGAANWKTRTGAAAFTPTIDGANRYTSLDQSPVTYDLAGNTTAVSGESYTWDGLGKLKTATVGGSTSQFRYDALGRRIVEIKDGQSNFVIWDGDAIAAVGPSSDSMQLRITSDASTTLALVAQTGRGSPVYLHPGNDHSTFVATDADAKVIEAYSYSSFGETAIIDPNNGATRAATAVRFLFQGQFASGFGPAFLMGAREYRPAWGRFLSVDPIGWKGGSNLYAFAAGAPLSQWDPTGLLLRQQRAWAADGVARGVTDARPNPFLLQSGPVYEESRPPASATTYVNHGRWTCAEMLCVQVPVAYAKIKSTTADEYEAGAVKAGMVLTVPFAAAGIVAAVGAGSVGAVSAAEGGGLAGTDVAIDAEGTVVSGNADVALVDEATAGEELESLGAARDGQFPNWNWKSRPTFRHTFETHGQGPKVYRSLLGRANTLNPETGQVWGPQGQWLDNEAASDYLRVIRPYILGPADVQIPQGLGQVVLGDGTVLSASWARVVPAPGGGYVTAFPVLNFW